MSKANDHSAGPRTEILADSDACVFPGMAPGVLELESVVFLGPLNFGLPVGWGLVPPANILVSNIPGAQGALRPHMGSLVAEAQELRDRVSATSGTPGAWTMSLTGAELRLLPYLATHLTSPEIATRLFISRNTVKSEATSIYRKLSASSRSEAIERAVEVGLLASSVIPRCRRLSRAVLRVLVCPPTTPH